MPPTVKEPTASVALVLDFECTVMYIDLTSSVIGLITSGSLAALLTNQPSEVSL